MKLTFFSLCVLFAGFQALWADDSKSYAPRTPSEPIAIIRESWHDAARDRNVPVKIYYPKTIKNLAPVIVFSHGLGGSRDGYEYLGNYWAGCGYISVHLQHIGSDDAIWKNKEPGEAPKALTAAAMNLKNASDRPRDVSFAIDRLTEIARDEKSPLAGHIDLEHIGVAGHSFGGYTSMAIAGQDFGAFKLADPRVKAVIEMSAPIARAFQRDHAYTSISVPVFHMTGTKDDSPIGETKAFERRVAYDLMKSAETCLLIFKDGDHMVFSGRVRPDEVAELRDEAFHKLICVSSVAYWDAWLKGDAAAHHWLMDGDFARLLGKEGTFEVKYPAK